MFNNGFQLVFLSGSMFGKKSKHLIDMIEQAKSVKGRCLVYKPTNDTRDGLFIKSRDYEETIPALAWDLNDENRMYKFKDRLLKMKNTFKLKAVFIDEVHFLPDEDIRFIYRWCRRYGFLLIVSGLIADFRQEEFPSSMFLSAVADHELFFHGTCNSCKNDNAIHNILYDINGNRVLEGDSIQPGDEEYKVLCEECFKNV